MVEEKDILLDKLTVKAEETPLAAGTDYTAAFDDNGYVNIVVIPGGAGDSATSLTVSGVQIDRLLLPRQTSLVRLLQMVLRAAWKSFARFSRS